MMMTMMMLMKMWFYQSLEFLHSLNVHQKKEIHRLIKMPDITETLHPKHAKQRILNSSFEDLEFVWHFLENCKILYLDYFIHK